MDERCSKDGIPRGHSWPLKLSLVDAELQRWHVSDRVDSVAFMYAARRRDAAAIGVTYIGERISTYQARPGHVALRVYSVPSAARSAILAELVDTGLPAACEWVAGIAGRPDTWRSENHQWTYELGGPATESPLAERGY